MKSCLSPTLFDAVLAVPGVLRVAGAARLGGEDFLYVVLARRDFTPGPALRVRVADADVAALHRAELAAYDETLWLLQLAVLAHAGAT